MARMWANASQIRTPICRQIALSSKSAVEILARTLHSSHRSSLSSSSSPLTSRSKWLSLISPHCMSAGLGGHYSETVLDGRYLPVAGMSPFSLLLRDARTHSSTGSATGRNEVEVEGASKNLGREILVRHLLVKEDLIWLLDELEQRIQEGADLSDLAEEHSSCPSKSAGGMIGWIKPGQTDPAFEEAAFNLPLNKVVRVKTKYGWHLLQVLNERAPRFLELMQVEELNIRLQDSNILEDAQLMDVRELDEISTASIKGFKAYPLSQFGEWAPTILDKLDPEKDTIVLCHHGMRSMQAANWLQSQGFRRIYNVAGGIHEYSKRVDPLVPKY